MTKMSAGPTNRSVLSAERGCMPRRPGAATVAMGTAVVELPVGGVTRGCPCAIIATSRGSRAPGYPSGARRLPAGDPYMLVPLCVRPRGVGLHVGQEGVQVHARILEILLERRELVAATERDRHQVGGVAHQQVCLAGLGQQVGFGARKRVLICACRDGVIRRDVAAELG